MNTGDFVIKFVEKFKRTNKKLIDIKDVKLIDKFINEVEGADVRTLRLAKVRATRSNTKVSKQEQKENEITK